MIMHMVNAQSAVCFFLGSFFLAPAGWPCSFALVPVILPLEVVITAPVVPDSNLAEYTNITCHQALKSFELDSDIIGVSFCWVQSEFCIC